MSDTDFPRPIDMSFNGRDGRMLCRALDLFALRCRRESDRMFGQDRRKAQALDAAEADARRLIEAISAASREAEARGPLSPVAARARDSLLFMLSNAHIESPFHSSGEELEDAAETMGCLRRYACMDTAEKVSYCRRIARRLIGAAARMEAGQ